MNVKRRAYILLCAGLLLAAGCGYRFVSANYGSGFSLLRVKNTTAQPGLGPVMEDALGQEAGLYRGVEGLKLGVAVDVFREKASVVSASGEPQRQELEMGIKWWLLDDTGRISKKGTETGTRTYPFSADSVSLDWQRNAAIELLAKDIARNLSEHLRGMD